ncbi:hypothetical protein DB345_11575 [Spartobacteria bacterium LR76]|nr:hypothetical protein DB345_11575 [Spartobacteria bacterium LR76]
MKTASKPIKKSQDESSTRNRRRLQKLLKELLSGGASFSSLSLLQSLESQKYPPLPYRRIIE